MNINVDLYQKKSRNNEGDIKCVLETYENGRFLLCHQTVIKSISKL